MEKLSCVGRSVGPILPRRLWRAPPSLCSSFISTLGGLLEGALGKRQHLRPVVLISPEVFAPERELKEKRQDVLSYFISSSSSSCLPLVSSFQDSHLLEENNHHWKTPANSSILLFRFPQPFPLLTPPWTSLVPLSDLNIHRKTNKS